MSEMNKNQKITNENELAAVSGGTAESGTAALYRIGQRIKCHTPFYRLPEDPETIEAVILDIKQDERGTLYFIENEYNGWKRNAYLFESDIICAV